MTTKTRRFIFWTITCLALIGLLVAVRFFRQPITVHARIAENGGFMPASLKARVGIPLRLRLIADDVEHSFALGQSDMEPVTFNPGNPAETTLIFDKPGTYTFYEAAPSSPNFWRMRGVIEVSGEGETEPSAPPLFVQLGLDLDEEHESAEEYFDMTRQPSAARGAAFESQIPAAYFARDYYVAHSPMQVFDDLRSEPALLSMNEEALWDIVALIWQKNSSAADLAEGRRLYQVNCAACHGENGAGDGQFADEMKAMAGQSQDEHAIQAPTDFTEAEHLLEAQPAKLHGLILRGGMGTGMPMWGSIFTEEHIWDLIAYLYSFQFQYQGVTQ